jgi:hypothetical protein
LEVWLELEVEGAFASVLADVSLPCGRRLLDLNIRGGHAGLWGSLCPEVGELAHRGWRRKIIKSEGVLPGRREEKTRGILLWQKHERETERKRRFGDSGRLGGRSGKVGRW